MNVTTEGAEEEVAEGSNVETTPAKSTAVASEDENQADTTEEKDDSPATNKDAADKSDKNPKEDEEMSNDRLVEEEEQDAMSTKSNGTDEDGASTQSTPAKSVQDDSIASPSAVSKADESAVEGVDDGDSKAETPSSKSETATPPSKKGKGVKRAPTAGQVGVKRPRGQMITNRKGRTPSVQGLTIPFRTVKKAMKLDQDIPIVQNEAAIMATMAAELFLKTLARQSHANAKHRGRNTIRYEDVAEARTQEPSYAFLEPLLP